MALDADNTISDAEYDLLFPVVPLDDDPSPPEQGQLDLVDDLADFAEDSLPDDFDATSGADEREDVVMDWESGEFFSAENSEPLRLKGSDAVIEQLIKRVYTPRGQFAIHSDDYGSNLEALIGANLTPEVTISEVDRDIRQCILAHPRVDEVDVLGITPATSLGAGVWLVAVEVVIQGETDPITLDLTF